MSAEENKALYRRVLEENISQGNMAVADELIAPDILDHTNPPGLQHGIASHKAVVTLFRTAFPDLQVKIENMLAEGDKVVARTTIRGTHQGPFFGIPPTGKQIAISGIQI